MFWSFKRVLFCVLQILIFALLFYDCFLRFGVNKTSKKSMEKELENSDERIYVEDKITWDEILTDRQIKATTSQGYKVIIG